MMNTQLNSAQTAPLFGATATFQVDLLNTELTDTDFTEIQKAQGSFNTSLEEVDDNKDTINIRINKDVANLSTSRSGEKRVTRDKSTWQEFLDTVVDTAKEMVPQLISTEEQKALQEQKKAQERQILVDLIDDLKPVVLETPNIVKKAEDTTRGSAAMHGTKEITLTLESNGKQFQITKSTSHRGVSYDIYPQDGDLAGGRLLLITTKRGANTGIQFFNLEHMDSGLYLDLSRDLSSGDEDKKAQTIQMIERLLKVGDALTDGGHFEPVDW